MEAVRSNQRVFELKPKFTPSAVAASGSIVAIGGEVSLFSFELTPGGVIHPVTYAGHEGAVVRLGWQGPGGGSDARGQQGCRQRSRIYPGRCIVDCGRCECALAFYDDAPAMTITAS